MINFGAKLLEPNRTQFRFWAPDCHEVAVEIENRGSFPMTLDADGVFNAEVGGRRRRIPLPHLAGYGGAGPGFALSRCRRP